jgi:hypothetical protein
MATRIELARQYMEYQRDQKTEESLALLADDVVMSNPMSGTVTGKTALQAALANRPAGGGGMNISWGEPEEDGGSVKIVGTGSPFGPVKVVLGFNDADQINRIDIGLA